MVSSTAGTGQHSMGKSFERVVAQSGCRSLKKEQIKILQVNSGSLCNMACSHCHVAAGPSRSQTMTEPVAQKIVQLLKDSPAVTTLDLTGGAPELHNQFRFLVEQARALGKEVIDRCNLTVLLEPGMEDLAPFLADNGVHIVASMPCYLQENVDSQRGKGTYEVSVQALLLLNKLGYGADQGLRLDLVYNPGGAFLPGAQAELEADYKRELGQRFGIIFDQLLTITNMPINRFAQKLEKDQGGKAYQELLVKSFNPATAPDIMCRSLLSVNYRGDLFDCDFNQMLGLRLGTEEKRTIWELQSLEELTGATIATATHCFGCTAGAGSSCSGALK